MQLKCKGLHTSRQYGDGICVCWMTLLVFVCCMLVYPTSYI